MVKANTLTAIDAGVALVIGTSGLTASDYAEIDRAARSRSVGVVASGNFSLTAAICQAVVLLARSTCPLRGDRLREQAGCAERDGARTCRAPRRDPALGAQPSDHRPSGGIGS